MDVLLYKDAVALPDFMGPMTLALIPLGFAMNTFMFWTEVKMFRHSHLKVRKNPLGFMIYAFVYSLLLQPISLMDRPSMKPASLIC